MLKGDGEGKEGRSLEVLTGIHRYSLDRHTSVRRTVGYHIPCRSAGATGNSVDRLESLSNKDTDVNENGTKQ